MGGAVAHQDARRVIGHVQPFVEIKGERVRAFDAVEAGAEFFAQHQERAERAVHMQPDALGGAHIGNLRQRIDGAGVDRAGGGDDGEGQFACGLVGADGVAQGFGGQAEFAVDGERA